MTTDPRYTVCCAPYKGSESHYSILFTVQCGFACISHVEESDRVITGGLAEAEDL